MAGYKYKAILDGTLSNPYRFVAKGTVITLPEPPAEPCSWLKTLEEAKAIKPIPAVPYVNELGAKNKPFQPLDALKPTTQEPAETLESGQETTSAPDAPAETTNPSGESAQGTGDQDVL